MSVLKAFQTEDDEVLLFGAYRSAGCAKASAASLFNGPDFTDIRVQRVPWLDQFAGELDDFEGDCGPNVTMACLRHGLNWLTDDDDNGGYKWLTSDDLHSEADWQALAEQLGADYPDAYKPEASK